MTDRGIPSPPESDAMWNARLSALKSFIVNNLRAPSKRATNPREKAAGQWLAKQKADFKNCDGSLSSDRHDRRVCFATFLAQEYSEIVCRTREAQWFDRLHAVEDFITAHSRVPMPDAESARERALGRWLSVQMADFQKLHHGFPAENLNRLRAFGSFRLVYMS